MHTKQRLVAAVAGMAMLPLFGETWTFTENADRADKNYWSMSSNWTSEEGGTNGVPRTGDCLQILKSTRNMHRAEHRVYMKKITFGPSGAANVAHSGFYLQGVEIGGEGFRWESTSSSSFWCGFWMDGTAIIDIATTASPNSCYFCGRDASHPGRFVKIGPGGINTASDATFSFFRGGTVREGTVNFATAKDMSTASVAQDLDFYFDGTASQAILAFSGRDQNLVNGYLHSSTNELPTTNHGVTDNGNVRTLTLSGNSPVDEQYYEGSFMGGLSFCWNPADASKRFTIARSESTTAGSLIVMNGTLTVTNGASFTALNLVRVEGNGVFEPCADAGGIRMNMLRFKGNGRIKLAAGQTFSVGVAMTNGVPLAFGEYTAANSALVTGEGTLKIDPYIDANDPIILDVATEQTLEAALEAYNEAHKDDAGFAAVSVATLNGGKDKTRSLVKRGLGKLNMMTEMQSFEGAVYVEEGVLYTGCRYSIGKENNDNAPVFVRHGATFATATSTGNMNVGRTFHIAGTGAGKVGNTTYNGALWCGHTFSGNYGNANAFGKAIILDDNATTRVGNWMFCGSETLRLNNFTLTAKGSGGDDAPLFLPGKFVDDGQVIIEDGQWKCSGGLTLLGTDPSNKVIFGTGGGWRFGDTPHPAFNGAGMKAWKFVFNGPSSELYADYNIQPRGNNKNILTMNTEVNTMVRLYYQGDRCRNHLQLVSPISGSGGFASTGDRTSYLHLLCGGNTFTGGFDFTRGTIWVYPDGAIPSGPEAGKVRLAPTAAPYDRTAFDKDGNLNTSATFHNTFDGIAFMQPVTYQLPDLEACGTFASRVQGGSGAWRTVTLNGKGLDYYSGIGGSLLNVEKGTFKLPRGAAPGLWEGTNVFANADLASAAYATTVTYTNLALRGPTSIIPDEAYNYTTWYESGRSVMTYSGFVWNRGAADVTWTFALAPRSGNAKIIIDGETVVEGSGAAVSANNVTLTPGAHAFECRLFNAVGARISSATWPANFGCAYDPEGRNDLSQTNYFQRCVDTGDGALFTRTTESVANLPRFEKVYLSAEGVMDVNGNRFVVPDLAGAGTIMSSAADASAAPSLVVSDGITVNAAADETLQVQVPVELGEAFSVSITNCAKRLRRGHTVLTATEPITGKTTEIPIVADDGKYWSARVSPDGKSLTVCRVGLALIVK